MPYISSPKTTETNEPISSGMGWILLLITGKSIRDKAITVKAFTVEGTPAVLNIGSMKRMMLSRSTIVRRMASSVDIEVKRHHGVIP